MPAIPQGSTVLVSGASGYIAAWVCKLLLERGFKVRGTVRSQEKGDYLQKTLGKGFEYVIVEDVEKQDGFDEAVKGVDAVAHVASPFHFKVEDPHKDLIHPAVNGTLSILKSAKKNGDKIKRIVITSSFASILEPHDPVYRYTEADWNEHSPKVVEEKGKDAPPSESYRASKVLAERAAWKFLETEKPGFDIATICPPLVLGPLIHQVSKPDSLNTSVSQFYKFLTGERKDEETTGFAGFGVDVRDVATAHIEALVQEKAGGNRYVVSKRSYSWQNVLDIAHEGEAGKAWPDTVRGKPGEGVLTKVNILDSTKSQKELGLQYHSFETTINEMALSLKEYSKSW